MKHHMKPMLWTGLLCSLSVAMLVVVPRAAALSRSTPSPNPLPLYRHLSVTHSCATPAGTDGVAGFKLPPNTPVTLLLDATPLATVATNAYGAFGTTITIPATTPTGDYAVTAHVPATGTSYSTPLSVSHEWGQAGFDAGHTRYDPCERTLSPGNVSQLTQAWTDSSLNLSPNASLAVSNGVAYIGTVGGFGSDAFTFYAFDTATGAINWSFPLPDSTQIYSPPAVANGLVFFGDMNDNLYALNAQTGASVWTDALGGQIIDGPTIEDGVLYLATYSASGGTLYAINAATGATIWSNASDGINSGDVAVGANGLIYAVCANANLWQMCAFSATTGALVWHHPSGDRYISGAPAVWQNALYYTAGDGNVYALNAQTGASLWTYYTGGGMETPPAVAYGMVYVAGPGGDLYAFDAATGAVLWDNSGTFVGTQSGTPSVANGMVFTAETDGKLHAYNAFTGVPLFSSAALSLVQITSPVTVDSGAVYVLAPQGAIFKLHLPQ